MIRRVSKNCDLRDYIKSCPSGVIDDIYKIEYYVQGNNVVIECSFTKVGETLEVILPTSQLELLPNGILMRRAYYKVVDTSYPDGYYNLEFEDCMNIWLGDYESEEPIIPEYVTEEELASELTSYATKDWVDSQQFLTAETLPSDIATQSWVSSNFLSSTALTGYATESWVESQGYLTSHQDLTGYATQSWVSSNFLSATALSGYATKQFVTDSLSGYATESWVISQSFAKQSEVNEHFRAIGDYLSEGIVPMISSLYSEIGDYGSIISDIQGSVSELYSLCDEFATHTDIDGVYSYIDEQSYATEQFVTDSLSGYATESWVRSYTYDSSTIDYACGKAEDNAITWVQEQGYLTSHQDLTGYATESWVSSNFLSSTALTGYATESWVSSQQFATESWVSAQDFLEESKVWCGTRSQWERLTSEEQAAYKIALVTA